MDVFYHGVLLDAERKARAMDAIRHAPHGYHVRICEPTRTLDQNAAQWPILQCFANQLTWPVNGERVQMTDEEWKDVLTAGFKSESLRLAQSLDRRGVVMLGLRTRNMNKREFSEWLDFLNASAIELGVNLTERA